MKLYDTLWIRQEFDIKSAEKLALKMGLFLPIAKYLVSRGITAPLEAEKFLRPTLEDIKEIHPIESTSNAVETIISAINTGERILIYGDYDVDGITSTFILYEYLKKIDAKVNYFIPNRHKDGYGINLDSLKFMIDDFDLLISVDCGITAFEEVEYLNKNGKTIIITDHHEPHENLPRAVIVNPKCYKNSFQDYAGVGVVYQLLLSLEKETKISVDNDALIFTAIGTIADLMPLADINRSIVKLGLTEIKNLQNNGLKILIQLCKVDLENVSASDIAFKVAPKINAAGRLSSASLAMDLFLEENIQNCNEKAKELVSENIRRKEIEDKIVEEATKLVNDNDSFIIVKGNNWNDGVIGIVASRLVDKFRKPTIVMTLKDNVLKGSGRSVGEFHLLNSLIHSKEYIEKFGGHKYAAGLAVLPSNFERFKSELNIYADKNLTILDKTIKYKYYDEIDSKMVTLDFVNDLDSLKPFGMGNPKPLFLLKDAKISYYKYIGKKKEHLKLNIQLNNRIVDAIGFNQSENGKLLKTSKTVDIIASIEKNNYMNVEYINLYFKDIRIANNQEIYYSKEYIIYQQSLVNIIFNYHKELMGINAVTLEYLIDKALLKNKNEVFPFTFNGKVDFYLLNDLKYKKYLVIFEKNIVFKIPTRDNLIEFYRRLKREKKIEINMFDKYENNNYNMDILSGKILSEIGVIEFESSDENITYIYKGQSQKNKMDLLDSQTYKNTLNFREDWNEFKRENKND